MIKLNHGQRKKRNIPEPEGIAYLDDITVQMQAIIKGDARQRTFTFNGQEFDLPSHKKAVIVTDNTGGFKVIPWTPEMPTGIPEISIRDANQLSPEELRTEIQRSLRRAEPTPKK